MILIDGRNEGLWFEPPTKGTRLRKKPPTSVVLHHTAGEGGASQVFRTLKNRGLSIHFVVDNDGRATSMADLQSTVCSHAGFMNEGSIGIEIANRGVPPAILSHLREVYQYAFRGGKERQFLKFYPQQVKTTWELLRMIHELTGIPLQWPDGEKVMAKPLLQAYSGILGHCHITETKVDPSPHIWADMEALAKPTEAA